MFDNLFVKIMGRRPRVTRYARARTPNFLKLKLAADSDEIDDCLQFAFTKDYADNDQLLGVLGGQRDQLVDKITWLENLVKEGERFLPLRKGGTIRLGRLKETLQRERKVLADLMKVIDSARKGREEKKAVLSCFV